MTWDAVLDGTLVWSRKNSSYVAKYLWVPIEHFYLFFSVEQSSNLRDQLSHLLKWRESSGQYQGWLETDGENCVPRTVESHFVSCSASAIALWDCLCPNVTCKLWQWLCCSVCKGPWFEKGVVYFFIANVLFQKRWCFPCIYFIMCCCFLKVAKNIITVSLAHLPKYLKHDGKMMATNNLESRNLL